MDHPPSSTIRENGPNRLRKLSRRPGRRITAATINQRFHRLLKRRRAGRSRRVTRRGRTTVSNVSHKATPITATPTTPATGPIAAIPPHLALQQLQTQFTIPAYPGFLSGAQPVELRPRALDPVRLFGRNWRGPQPQA